MDYQLKYCVWEITLRCNLRCRHCGSKAGFPRTDELTLTECYNVAGQLHSLGCEHVSLIGGEILLREDWHKISSKLISHGIQTNIITNGCHLGNKERSQIRSSGIESVCISIDGCEEAHNQIRNKNCFEDCINTVNILKADGYRVTVITTLNTKNIMDLNALYAILTECRVNVWQLQLCAPFGNASGSLETISTMEQIHSVMQFIVEKRKDGRMQIGAADNIGYFTEQEQHLRAPLGKPSCFRGCNAGIDSIGIDSIGNVRGCQSLYAEEFIEGNLRDRTLAEMWRAEHAFAYNRAFQTDMLTGKCASCSMGRLCAGGCRSMNYFGHGKLYESYICAKTDRAKE